MAEKKKTNTQKKTTRKPSEMNWFAKAMTDANRMAPDNKKK